MKTATEAALKILNTSPRSEFEIRTKLHDKFYTDEEIDEAVLFCKKYNYINDENYAKMYIEYNAQRYGRKLLSYKLMNEKKVDLEIIDNALDEVLTHEKEIKYAKEIAEKYIKVRHLESDEKQKVLTYLAGKGFSYDISGAALNDVFNS